MCSTRFLPWAIKVRDQRGVPLAVGTVAGGLAAAAVGQGERARQGVGRDLETSQQLPFAAAQGVGGRAWGF